MDGRRRSRSSSRERDSSRRRHRKHKHKSRRSRSRSRSYERNGGLTNVVAAGIHINPAFGMPPGTSAPPPQPQIMGYSASQLLQTNNMMEAEICRLKNALLSEQGGKQIEIQRNQMLQQEIRNAQIQRDNAVKRCNEVMSERRSMIDMRAEMANRINGLEVSNRMLHDEIAQANQATEAKNEEIRAITFQSQIVRQQIAALNDRNAALKTKCETMVAQNRQQCEELEAKQKFVEAAQLNVRKAEADLQCANLEIQRLMRELNSSQQLESTSLNDKRSIEAALQRKEDEIRVTNYKAAAELKSANEKIEKLENRLKSEKPAMHHDMTVETIYGVIETIKSTYEKQLTRLEEEIEQLKQEREDTKQMEEGDDDDVAQHQMIEELPEYLQTPMKPDPAKMGGVKKTVQVKIKLDRSPTNDNDVIDRPPRPSSGPPVDSPVTWHRRKPFERLPPLVVPLFGTTVSNIETHNSISDDVITDPTTSSNSEDVIHDDPAQEINIPPHCFTEEDLLLGEPADLISPNNQTLELSEQQLLDGEQ